MEFKRNPNSYNRNRLNIPGRSEPTRFSSAQPQQQPKSAGQLFEPDEPLIDEAELEDISFRDILGAWGKKAVKHSPLENKLKAGKKKTERLKKMKNDLKWALMADLDEPVKPRQKPQAPVHSHPQHHAPVPRPVATNIVRPGAIPHRPQPTPVAAPASAANTAKSIDISINFGSLPKIPWHKLKALLDIAVKFIRARSKKQLILAAVVVVVAIVAITALQIQQHAAKYNPDGSLKVSSQKIDDIPDYKMIMPKGSSATSVGNVKRVSPPDRNAVYAFADDFRGTKITVSEQPIPESFKPDIAGSVETLAKNYAATDKITISGILVYIGTSHEGPQSIIFTKNGLLVLIKSDSTRDENDWAWYADQLK